jgi:putative membrane protein
MVASKLFSPEDRKAVSAAVAEAEKKTSAEIVPVVATASDRYERAEDLIGLAASLVAVASTWTLFQPGHSDWESDPDLTLRLPLVLGVVVVGWALGVFVAKVLPWLKRLAVSRGTMTARVLIAAHQAFDSLHAHKTTGGTGVVIYLSLFERRVCVWADRAVSAKIPETEWKDITESLVRSIRDGKARDGLVEAIRKCGDVLGKHFPIQPSDVNELPNELRLLD